MTMNATKALAALALLTAPLGATGDHPFTPLDFEAALQRSRDEGRVLVVDVMTTWCPPCKRMEAEVWPEESVVAWLDEHGLAIQVDGDEQRELVRSWGVDAYPTMLAWKDGELFDRTVGYASAEDLLAWLDDVRALDAPLTEDDKLAALEDEIDLLDPMQRMDLARECMGAGRLDAALEHHVWLWRESLEHSPSFTGVRVSFLISDIARLLAVHEPAREAFGAFYDEARASIDAGDVSAWRDWRALGKLFDQDDEVVVEWYDAHREEDGGLPSRVSTVWVTRDVFDELVARERWSDAGMLLLAPALEGRNQVMRAEMMASVTGDADRAWAAARDEVGVRYAALVAAGRRDEAGAMAGVVLDARDTPAMRAALVDALREAGLPTDAAETYLASRGEAIAADVGDDDTSGAFVPLSFDAARARAAADGKPLLVDFTADWCPPCKRMERDVWPKPDVVAWLGEHVVAIQVDVDDHGELAAEHDITSIPTLVLLRDGDELARTTGYHDASDLLRWLRSHASP